MKKSTRKRRNNLFLALSIFLITGAFLVGCGKAEGSPAPQETDVFKPPSAVPTATPTRDPLPTPTPTQDENCTNQLQFDQDVTIPDGTEVDPGESLVKQWMITNAGTCNWDQRYKIKLVSGPDLGASRSQALYPARNGQQVILEMTFTAPEEPGQYTSTWQAFDPQGQRFGDPFFIDIQVIDK